MAEGPKILVVDDELIVIKSAQRILTAEGYTVEGALGGREAILNIEQNSFDLVLTDLKMPEVDGITLIRWIKNSRPATGIVIITGYPSQDTIKEALELGIIDYVPKPFTPAALIDVTERAIEWIKGRKPEVKEVSEEFPPSMLTELDRVIDEYKHKPGSSIPVLQRCQEVVGYLPPLIQKRIAKGLSIPAAEIHSIVSFYSFFTMKPRGDHTINVCLGTACFVKGVEAVLSKIKEVLKVDVGDTTEDRKFSLEAVRCLGCCALAPVMVVDHDTHSSLTPKKIINALNQYEPVKGEEVSEEELEGLEAEIIEGKEG
jgi:NADP-reducing hydrogenase subunit HndA